MRLTEENVKKFEIFYSGLCRNVKKIYQLRPTFFTKKILDDYNHCLERIGKNYVMSYNFREGLYRLFLIVLKMLDDPKTMLEGTTMYSRMVHSYRKKYMKKLKKVLSNNILFKQVNELTEEIYGELTNRVAELKSEFESASAQNINYGVRTEPINGPVPVAREITLKTATYRFANSPIDNKAPLASVTFNSPKTFKSRKSKGKKKSVKGTKI